MPNIMLPFDKANRGQITDGTVLFKRLADLGYIVIPIVPHDREFVSGNKTKPGGKVPGRYDPSTSTWHGLPGWQRYLKEPPSDHMLRKWASYTSNGLPGVGTLTGDLICAADLDLTHPELAKAVRALADRILGKTEFIRIGASPKALLVFRLVGTEPLIKIRSASYELDGHSNQAVEILGRGQQFVAFGVHPATKRPYTWPEKSLLDARPEDLPEVTPAQLRDFIREFEFLAEVYGATAQTISTIDDAAHISSEQADGRGHIAAAIAALPAALADEYHSWVRVGLAVKAALPEDPGLALELWDEFSAKSDKYDPIATAEKFETFHATRIGAGTLYRLAEAAGWTPPEGIIADAADEFTAVEVEALNERPNPNKRNALYYKKPSDISATLHHAALVEDLIDAGSMSVLYGDSNVGKSFVALDLAFHIATGRDWDSKKVIQGAVIYVAAEGGKSAENRIAALKAAHNLLDFPLFLVPCPVDLLHHDADTKPLIKLIQSAAQTEGHPVRLVVIDTLSRAMAGGNENDSKDMGAFVQHVDAIREASNAHLMIVHHSGKDKAKGARGHSLLRAATDTEIEVADRQITATKQRDMEFSKPIGFELRIIELGLNPYGKKITSCVVDKVDPNLRAEFSSEFALEPRDALVLNAFLDIVASLPRNCEDATVEQRMWARMCKHFDLNRVPGCPPWPADEKSFNKAFKRSRDRLSQLGYISAAPGAKRGAHWVSGKVDKEETGGVS